MSWPCGSPKCGWFQMSTFPSASTMPFAKGDSVRHPAGSRSIVTRLRHDGPVLLGGWMCMQADAGEDPGFRLGGAAWAIVRHDERIGAPESPENDIGEPGECIRAPPVSGVWPLELIEVGMNAPRPCRTSGKSRRRAPDHRNRSSAVASEGAMRDEGPRREGSAHRRRPGGPPPRRAASRRARVRDQCRNLRVAGSIRPARDRDPDSRSAPSLHRDGEAVLEPDWSSLRKRSPRGGGTPNGPVSHHGDRARRRPWRATASMSSGSSIETSPARRP
jgi:hypothetical protein